MKKHGEEYSDGNDDAIDFTDNEATSDMEFDGGLKIPGQIWHKLYKLVKANICGYWRSVSIQCTCMVSVIQQVSTGIHPEGVESICQTIYSILHSDLTGDNRRLNLTC